MVNWKRHQVDLAIGCPEPLEIEPDCCGLACGGKTAQGTLPARHLRTPARTVVNQPAQALSTPIVAAPSAVFPTPRSGSCCGNAYLLRSEPTTGSERCCQPKRPMARHGCENWCVAGRSRRGAISNALSVTSATLCTTAASELVIGINGLICGLACDAPKECLTPLWLGDNGAKAALATAPGGRNSGGGLYLCQCPPCSDATSSCR